MSFSSGSSIVRSEEETMCKIDQSITSIQNCLETIFISREYKGYKAFLKEIKDDTLGQSLLISE